jgi:hypothetical protein
MTTFYKNDEPAGYPRGGSVPRAIVQINGEYDAAGFIDLKKEYDNAPDMKVVPYPWVHTADERAANAGEIAIEVLSNRSSSGYIMVPFRTVVNGIPVDKPYLSEHLTTEERKKAERRALRAALYGRIRVLGIVKDTVSETGARKSVIITHGLTTIMNTHHGMLTPGDTCIAILPKEGKASTSREVMESAPLTKDVLIDETIIDGEVLKFQEFQGMLDGHGMMFFAMFVQSELQDEDNPDERAKKGQEILCRLEKFLNPDNRKQMKESLKRGMKLQKGESKPFNMKLLGQQMHLGEAVAETLTDDAFEPIRNQFAEDFIPAAGISMNNLSSRIIGVIESHSPQYHSECEMMVCTPTRMGLTHMQGL